MQVIKRDGQVADFDPDKIYQAILKAAQTVYPQTVWLPAHHLR